MGKRILNPETVIEIGEDSYMEMDSVQIKGVDSTKRLTTAKLAKGAKLEVMERIMTHGIQTAESRFEVELNGENSSANVVSRSVARESSHQLFVSNVIGNANAALTQSVIRLSWMMPRSARSRRSRQIIRMQR